VSVSVSVSVLSSFIIRTPGNAGNLGPAPVIPLLRELDFNAESRYRGNATPKKTFSPGRNQAGVFSCRIPLKRTIWYSVDPGVDFVLKPKGAFAHELAAREFSLAHQVPDGGVGQRHPVQQGCLVDEAAAGLGGIGHGAVLPLSRREAAHEKSRLQRCKKRWKSGFCGFWRLPEDLTARQYHLPLKLCPTSKSGLVFKRTLDHTCHDWDGLPSRRWTKTYSIFRGL
jgi:hypothetical protein